MAGVVASRRLGGQAQAQGPINVDGGGGSFIKENVVRK